MIDRSGRCALIGGMAAAFALAAAICELGRLDANGWGIIDDHEILSWIGARDRLPPSEFIRALGTTEVLDSSRAVRFRPVYYAIRIGEAVAFGKDVALWYGLLWSIYALSVFLLAYGLLRYVAADLGERALALAGMMLVLGRVYWMDSFGRLGPSEYLAILGSSVALLGLLALFPGKDRRLRWYCALVGGSVFAAGSKENLLILLAPLAAVCIRDWRSASRTGRAVLGGGVLALLAMGARVVSVVSSAGSDIYGNSVAVHKRLAMVLGFLARPEVLTFGGVGLLIAAVAVASHASRPEGPARAGRQAAVLAAVLLGCTATAATQFVFYAGQLPSRSRYDFPYLTLFDFGAVVGAILALRLVRGGVARWPHGTALVRTASVLLAAGFLAAGVPGMKTTRADVRGMRRNNRACEERLRRSVEAAARGGATSIVLYARRGLDYEPVMSIARQLTARQVTLPIHLKLADGSDQASEGAFEKGLLAEMNRWSTQGYEAMRPLPRGGTGRCFSFGFEGPPDPHCPIGTDIWPIRAADWEAGR